MRELVRRKKVIVPYNGYIKVLGVYGPVTIPFMATFEKIAEILSSGKPVTEILNDGTKVKLTLVNYDQCNSADEKNSSIKKTFESIKREKPVKSAPKLITDEDVKKASMEQILQNSTKKFPDGKSVDYTTKNDSGSKETSEEQTSFIGKENRQTKKDKYKKTNGPDPIDMK